MVRINAETVERVLDAVERGELVREDAWDRLMTAGLPADAACMRLDSAEGRRDREG